MEEQQKFQAQWQIDLHKIHSFIEQVINLLTFPFRKLDPTTQMFQRELDRKTLILVK